MQILNQLTPVLHPQAHWQIGLDVVLMNQPTEKEPREEKPLSIIARQPRKNLASQKRKNGRRNLPRQKL